MRPSNSAPASHAAPLVRPGGARRRLALVAALSATAAQSLLVLRCVHAAEREALVAVAASAGLHRGERLTARSLRGSVRLARADAEAFLAASEAESAQGLYARSDIAPGVPLRVDQLSEKPVLAADVDAIPPGRVLFPLNVRLGALAPLLEPGRRVDVLARMNLPDAGTVTETLLEGVAVVSVGERPGDDGRSEGDVVSFHLTPEQVKLLVHAERFSEFRLVLRNPRDPVSQAHESAMTINRFLANPRIQGALAEDVFLIRSGVKEPHFPSAEKESP